MYISHVRIDHDTMRHDVLLESNMSTSLLSRPQALFTGDKEADRQAGKQAETNKQTDKEIGRSRID